MHSLCATASCTACADACPSGAIILTDSSLGINEAACDGCGLCRPACPEGAVDLPGVRFDALLHSEVGIALLGCKRAGVTAGRGVVPCLHAVAERDLAALTSRQIETVVTVRGDCASCPQACEAKLEDAVARVNALAGLTPRPRSRHKARNSQPMAKGEVTRLAVGR